MRLDEGEELAQRIKIAIDEGKEVRGASSGAVGHLVRYGKAGLINVWPVGELAIFDTNEWRKPANQLAVVEAKRGEWGDCFGAEYAPRNDRDCFEKNSRNDRSNDK